MPLLAPLSSTSSGGEIGISMKENAYQSASKKASAAASIA